MPPKKRGKSAKGGRSGGGEGREAALAHKAAGNAAFSAGDYTTAIAEFSAAIKADGSDAVFWGNRSACHAALGDFKAAVADGQKCVELRPEWSKGYGRLGLALFRLGDLAGAQRAYAQGLSIDPDSDALADALSEVRRAAKAQAMNNDRDEALSGAMDGMDAGSAPDPPDVAPVQVGHVIGIDLGTTYSCVAVWRNGEPEVIANEEGERTTPSWVAFTAEGERLVGDSAKRQAAMNPTRTLFNIKRIIGRQFSECSEDIKRMPFPVTEGKGGRPSIEVDVAGTKRMYMPEQISAMVLEKMKATAEMALGEKVSKAVVTVPAYFNDSQRRLTKDAGAIAGLDVLRIINEPTAAALAYGLDKAAESEEEQNVLVFDLGGGTFDVSLLRIESGVFEVLATAGDTHLGGEDFDSAVADWVAGEVKRKHKQDYFTGDARNTRKLRAASERAKRQLSSSQTAQVELSVGDEEICVELSRAKFEKLNETTFQRCMDAVQRVMKDANLKKTDVGEIVLVGGSTRVPRVQKILQDYFDGKQLCKSVNPDEAVAYGAAVQGAILAGVRDPSMQSLLLVDVIPLSLGVECEGKQFAKVVPRNTSVPCKKSSEFTTVEDWQTEIDIRIFEGERQNTDGNHLLGEFNITGVERARRGEAKVDVTFEVNTNGLLTVSARDKVTGARANVEIQHDRGRLSSEEVERMMAEAERYREEDERRAREYEERRARELEDDDY